jgi:hypothetical protein
MIRPLGNLRAGVYFCSLDWGVFGLVVFDFGVRLLDFALPVLSVSGGHLARAASRLSSSSFLSTRVPHWTGILPGRLADYQGLPLEPCGAMRGSKSIGSCA